MMDMQTKEIIKKIRTKYQPIIDLNTGFFFGQEALTRGEKGDDYETPLSMIRYFNEKSQTPMFDMACHTSALENFDKSNSPGPLFLNVENITMLSDTSHMEWLGELLSEHGLKKSDVVLEVCERHYEMDEEARKACFKRYIDFGFSLALDDIDSSMMSLSEAMMCHWSYIKLSSAIIKDIEKSDDRKAFVQAVVSYARYKHIRVIAEGVETQEALKALIALNVDYAQGYMIGRPDFADVERDYRMEALIRHYQKKKHKVMREDLEYQFVGQIMVERISLNENTRCGQVLEIFKSKNEDALCILNDSGRIIGCIAKHELYRMFSTQFGFSLYNTKPIKALCESSPLVVNYHDSIKSVLEAAMSRDENQIYDDIIVANNGKYLGMVSMRQVINAYNEQDNKKATQLNPLTALPGNHIINNNIRKYMALDIPVLFAYADLSDFKVYNDFYGFENGDMVICKTAEILSKTFSALPYPSFVGHIGGDDFVCMCEFPTRDIASHHILKRTLDDVIERFEKAKPVFFSDADYRLGYIKESRQHGKYTGCALTNINIACYFGRLKRFDSLEAFAEFIAVIKRQSKQKKFSNYIVRHEAEDKVVDLLG